MVNKVEKDNKTHAWCKTDRQAAAEAASASVTWRWSLLELGFELSIQYKR